MAQGVRSEWTEIDTFVKQRLEWLVADMDFVPREEFEAVKAMARQAPDLKTRPWPPGLAALEAQSSKAKPQNRLIF